MLILLCFGLRYENVIRFPDQNTLRTRVKQIRNPQKEISGGFFIFLNTLLHPQHFLLEEKLDKNILQFHCLLKLR